MISEHGDKEPEFLKKKKKKGEIILQARQGKCVKRKLVGTGDLGSFWCHGEHGAGTVSPPPPTGLRRGTAKLLLTTFIALS